MPKNATDSENLHRKNRARKNSYVSILREASRIVKETKSVSILLKKVLDVISARAYLNHVSVTLCSGDFLVIRASNGLTQDESRRGIYRLGEGVTGRVAQTGQARLIEDISLSDEFLNKTESRKDFDKTAFICVPIISSQKVIGTLSADCDNSDKSVLKKNLLLLETVSNIVSDAVSVLFFEMEEGEKLHAENRVLRDKVDIALRPQNAIGSSAAMLKVYEQIANACESEAHVLIRGEPGSGKDFAMRIIANSPRWRSRPIEILDCSTMRDSLIDELLFGSPSKRGLIEQADDGIVYLDAMGLIGQALQLKLLKYLEGKKYCRVGDTTERFGRARIIASTSGDLEKRMKEGIIRPDFYYQISLSTIMIPPLRERRRDIPALAKFFMQKHAHLHEKKIVSISQSAMNMMKAYHWPTNVRELENCMERAVIIAAGQSISVSDLPPSLQTAQSTNTSIFDEHKSTDFKKLVGDFERDIIVEALASKNGNAAAVARRLSVSRRILNYKIEKLGIPAKSFKQSSARRAKGEDSSASARD